MPPKTRSLTTLESAAQAAVDDQEMWVRDSVDLFTVLPTCALLIQIVGICTRVSSQIAMLNCSESSSASSDRVPVGVMMRALCAKLRNRRQCVQCAQCLRFMCTISDFAKAISTALSHDS